MPDHKQQGSTITATETQLRAMFEQYKQKELTAQGGSAADTPPMPIPMPIPIPVPIPSPAATPTPPLKTSSTSKAAPSSKAAPNPDLPDHQLCIVCLDKPRAVAFMHGEAAHFCVCRGCAAKFEAGKSRCPMCQAGIDRKIDIFG